MTIRLQSWLAVNLACWILLSAYWLLAAVSKRRETKRKESKPERLSQLLAMAAAYILMFTDVAHYGWLGTRFIPKAVELEALGTIFTICGVGLAIWARRCLGVNWSAQVTIRADHELIRTGPYQWIRHPIYTGMLVALAGTALTLGERRGVISFGIALAAFYLKARKEERFLAQEFGPSFAEHVRTTGMFLPRVP